MPLTEFTGWDIFYHEEGIASGGPPLLFIHGWTCDHTAMLPLAERFSQDHRWAALDLLGHGRSAKPEHSYRIQDQAEIVEAFIQRWATSRPVVIGHSMGGQIAVELAARANTALRGIILLDPAPIIPHEKAVEFGRDVARQLSKQDIPTMLAAFARRQIIQAADPDAVDDLIDVMTATPAHVVRAAWDSLINWPGESRLKEVNCPILTISADKPLNRPTDLVKAHKKLMTAQTAGAGHMQQYEVPDQLEAMTRRFLDLLT